MITQTCQYSHLQRKAMEEKRQQQQQIVRGRRSVSFNFKYPCRTQRIVPQFHRATAIVEMNELKFKNILDDDNNLCVRYNRDPEHFSRSWNR